MLVVIPVVVNTVADIHLLAAPTGTLYPGEADARDEAKFLCDRKDFSIDR